LGALPRWAARRIAQERRHAADELKATVKALEARIDEQRIRHGREIADLQAALSARIDGLANTRAAETTDITRTLLMVNREFAAQSKRLVQVEGEQRRWRGQ
jgi:hypothetical protein